MVLTRAKVLGVVLLGLFLSSSADPAGEARAWPNQLSQRTELVDEGQFVSIPAFELDCGHNVRTTSRYAAVVVQKAVIYRNCAVAGSVARRGDAELDGDGPCLDVPAGTARVLQAKFVFPRIVWRGAYAC